MSTGMAYFCNISIHFMWGQDVCSVLQLTIILPTNPGPEGDYNLVLWLQRFSWLLDHTHEFYKAAT